MELRPYQKEMIENIEAEHAKHRSTLVVAATGTGKTVVFTEYIRRSQARRALVVAHTRELIDQAYRTLHRAGIDVDIEQAERYARRQADHGSAVVASVQTLAREYRLQSWPQDAFDLVIIDEAHRSEARSYKKLTEWFGEAKVLGVTATPDRGDGRSLRRMFDSVAHRYEIKAAIDDGYLVPVSARSIVVKELSLDGVKVTAGDFQAGKLSEAMEAQAILEKIAQPLMREVGARKTIVFGPSVAWAHALAKVLNRYEPGVAISIDGSMDKVERGMALKRSGYRVVVNCAVLTEGYDDWEISCVAMCRPTKSRALYTQCVGRGTRPCRLCPVPIAGPCEHKSDLLVLDFAGISEKHSLIGPVDVFAGTVKDKEVMAAARRHVEQAGEGGMSVEDAIKRAKSDVAKARAEAKWKAKRVDPFKPSGGEAEFSLELQKEPQPFDGGVTAALGAKLEKVGVARHLIHGMTPERARGMLATLRLRDLDGMASYKQCKFMIRMMGMDKPHVLKMTKKEAMDVIGKFMGDKR